MILKKDFNKLSQLDRIEFRQRDDAIRKTYESDNFGQFINAFIVIGLLGAILAGAVWGHYGLTQYLLHLSDSIIFITIIFVITFAIDVIYYIKKEKAYGELVNDYFKVEVNRSGKRKK